ncbi:MAG: Membrane alanyl aminopeptidase [Sphingobacteriales bacterium]|nr:Membrane alanyl aminopeptidase [Sphingobacteriales bacterium]
MKLNVFKCCFITAAFFIISCSTRKTPAGSTISQTSPWLSESYRATYPKVTDIINTRLDVSFNWDSAFVIGKATILAKPYFYPSNQVVLDANGFQINTVSLIKGDDRIPLKYSYNNKKLVIQLDKTYTKDQKFSIFVDYVAMPYKLKVGPDIDRTDDRGIYFINRDGKDKNKPKQIWTQGETECNSSWFPTINGPQEKMTQEVNITVANEFITLSNGTLEYSSLNGNGTRTDSWRQEQPHSTYLTMLAVGKFTIAKDTWNDKEVNYYTEPEYAPLAKKVFGKTPEMMQFFSKKLGVDYPWDKYSQIVVRDFVSGAMENTSATVLFDKMNMTEGQYLDQDYEDFIAHELFHQWFGDLVTAESWSNLSLNESFATYGEYLWMEFKYGRDYADLHGMEDLQTYLRSAKDKEVPLIRYNYSDREHMFDEVSYQKGGRILNMLRRTVGDDAFFKSINLYLTKNAYKTAEIHDLRMAFEEVTGQDLNWFFTEWFLAPGHPKLTINTLYDSNSKQVNISIRQNQDLTKVPLYRIPLAVDIYVNNRVERKEIILENQNQSFSFKCDDAPSLINVDAEKYVVGEKTENKSLEQYIYQYQHAPLFMDRYEAVAVIKNHKENKDARSTMIMALNDKNEVLRRSALDFVSDLNDDEKKSSYDRIVNIALKDEKSLVRAAAIKQLFSTYSSYDNDQIYKEAKKDRSASVIKALNNISSGKL